MNCKDKMAEEVAVTSKKILTEVDSKESASNVMSMATRQMNARIKIRTKVMIWPKFALTAMDFGDEVSVGARGINQSDESDENVAENVTIGKFGDFGEDSRFQMISLMMRAHNIGPERDDTDTNDEEITLVKFDEPLEYVPGSVVSELEGTSAEFDKPLEYVPGSVVSELEGTSAEFDKPLECVPGSAVSKLEGSSNVKQDDHEGDDDDTSGCPSLRTRGSDRNSDSGGSPKAMPRGSIQGSSVSRSEDDDDSYWNVDDGEWVPWNHIGKTVQVETILLVASEADEQDEYKDLIGYCPECGDSGLIGNGKTLQEVTKIGQKHWTILSKDGTKTDIILEDCKYVPDLWMNPFAVTKCLRDGWNISNDGATLCLQKGQSEVKFDKAIKTHKGLTLTEMMEPCNVWTLYMKLEVNMNGMELTEEMKDLPWVEPVLDANDESKALWMMAREDIVRYQLNEDSNTVDDLIVVENEDNKLQSDEDDTIEIDVRVDELGMEEGMKCEDDNCIVLLGKTIYGLDVADRSYNVGRSQATIGRVSGRLYLSDRDVSKSGESIKPGESINPDVRSHNIKKVVGIVCMMYKSTGD